MRHVNTFVNAIAFIATIFTLHATEPTLPMGLNGEDLTTTASTEKRSPVEISGFWEARFGMRIRRDPTQKDLSIAETRLQMQLQQFWEQGSWHITTDLLYDPVLDNHQIDLNKGEGWIDLREAYLVLRYVKWADIQIGRQILTWGTGDLLFINDLFPKDWNAFFIGRNETYLKAPSDVIKASIFLPWANIDLVYAPGFDSDRFIDGRRLSYYQPFFDVVVGRNWPVFVDRKDTENEFSARIYRNFSSYEAALYAYIGYWKSPAGTDFWTGDSTFPPLKVWGASLRGPLKSGIANVEVGYYKSSDDSHGTDPWIRNSEWRLLIGYEQEIKPELTGSFQYYLEHMVDHDAYLENIPFPWMKKKDKNRHVLTARLTKLLKQQTVILSLFNFFSPSDCDGYLRLNGQYKINDAWKVESGANIFYGKRKHTFFGQFRENSNIYVGIHYGFSNQ